MRPTLIAPTLIVSLITSLVRCDQILSSIFADKRTQCPRSLRATIVDTNDPAIYALNHIGKVSVYRTRIHNDPFIEVGILNYPEKHGFQAYSMKLSEPISFEELRRLPQGAVKMTDRSVDAVFDIWTDPPDLESGARGDKWNLQRKVNDDNDDDLIFLINENTKEPHIVHSYGTLRLYKNWMPLSDYFRMREDDLPGVLEGFRQTGMDLMSQFVDLRKLKTLYAEDEQVQADLLTLQKQIQEVRWHLAEELSLRFNFEFHVINGLWNRIRTLHAKHLQHCFVTPDNVWIRGWSFTSPFNLSVLPELVEAAEQRNLMVVNEPNIIFTAFSGHQTPQKSPRMSFLLSKDPTRFLATNAGPMSYLTRPPDVSLEGYATMTEGLDPQKCFYPKLLMHDNLAFLQVLRQVLLEQVEMVTAALFAERPDGQDLFDFLDRDGVHPFSLVKKWCDLLKLNLKQILSMKGYETMTRLRLFNVQAQSWGEKTLVGEIPDVTSPESKLKFAFGFMYGSQKDHFWRDVQLADDESYLAKYDKETADLLLKDFKVKNADGDISHGLDLIEKILAELRRIASLERTRFQLRNSGEET